MAWGPCALTNFWGISVGKHISSRALSRFSLRGVAFTAAAVLAVGALATTSASVSHKASADSAPVGGLPATVTADALPTVQINGVAWSQVTVGNTVYVTGSFTQARRPALRSAAPAR